MTIPACALKQSQNKLECACRTADAAGASSPFFLACASDASRACPADGFRLKEFPDDPIKIATKEATEQSTNPILNWFNALDSPLNRD